MLWYLNKIKKRVDIDDTLKTSFVWVYYKGMLLAVLTSWLIYINQSDELNDSVGHNIVKKLGRYILDR